MKNYKIDETLLPEVWLTWKSSNGRIWMNKNGKRQSYPEYWMRYRSESDINKYSRENDGKIPFGNSWATRNNNRLWISAGTKLYYTYVKYHKDIDRLELALVQYDTTRGDHKHEWKYVADRMFFGRDKSVVDENGLRCSGVVPKPGYYPQNVRNAIQTILRCNAHPKWLEEFHEFLGANYFVMGNGTTEAATELWHITKWYTTTQKTRSKGKAQKVVDKLVETPLGSIEGLAYKYPPKLLRTSIYYGDEYTNNILYFEPINDEWGVLRALIRNNEGEFDEGWRVYLGADGSNVFATLSDKEWISASQHRGWDFNHKYYFANLDEATEKCNRIKYIASTLDKNDGVSIILNTLRFPAIEQLHKMGYKKLASHLARSGTPKADMKEIFGSYYKEKEKNVLRQIGLTKHQLDKYDSICINRDGSYSPWRGNVLKKMRELFGEDLSHIDNATYDKYIEACWAMTDNFWAERYINNLNIDLTRFWRNLVRLADKNSESYRIMSDTLSLYNRLNARPDIDWFFDDYSDLVRVHDALNELVSEQERERMAYYNMAEAERRRLDDAKREKVDKERRCYEYEDENFIIRLPKDVNEIISEGSRQSICIGGYTTRHSRGETNLFFLRRKNDPTTPFYAIEMDNSKVIVQIHGFGNKWLGNNPEAIPTVVRWLRKHNIKCDNSILTCTARGYTSNYNYIPMPIVD